MTDVLPTLEGNTLSGRTLRLPEDLPASGMVLVIGFTHGARHDVGAWKAALRERDVPFLSLPTSVMDLPAEEMAAVAQAMRDHVPSLAWDQVVQIHRGGEALRAAFGWKADTQAKVLRVGPKGEILGRHDAGPFSMPALRSLLCGIPFPVRAGA